MQMANTVASVALAVCLIGGFMVSAAAQPAGDKADHIMVTSDAVKWGDAPPSLPAGAKWAVLEGDPTQPGPFTFRVKVPGATRCRPTGIRTLSTSRCCPGHFTSAWASSSMRRR